MTSSNSAVSAPAPAARIVWDSAPIVQQFGKRHVVADGVATLPDGRTFRINATAAHYGTPEIGLRYLTDAKRGQFVPESALPAVREAAQAAAKELFAAFRRAVRAGDDRPTLDSLLAAIADAARRAALTPADCVRRNAEAARVAVLTETGRNAFDPARPYRVRNRTPNSSVSFDFATLAEAREYLAAQTARHAFVTGGAAPVGPRSDSIDPFESFIFWPTGTETLADSPWDFSTPGFAQDWTGPALTFARIAEIVSAPAPDAAPGPEAAPALACGNVFPAMSPRENETGPFAWDELTESEKREARERFGSPAPHGRRAFYFFRPGKALALSRYAIVPEAETRSAWAIRDDAKRAAPAPAPVRRDNVEYHAGKAARAAGETRAACPYLAGERAARWNLGWTEAAPVETIDCTPTWAGILPALLALIENGSAEGRRTAREELARMAALADERNALATATAAHAARLSEMVSDWPTMRGLSASGAERSTGRKIEAREMAAALAALVAPKPR